MERARNTTVSGQEFRPSIIEAVWGKGRVVGGSNPDKFRKDACGAWMVKSSFGKNSQFGWEVDHTLPVSKGGKDDLQNLQPLHWENNEGKADNHPNWTCIVKENQIRPLFYKELERNHPLLEGYDQPKEAWARLYCR